MKLGECACIDYANLESECCELYFEEMLVVIHLCLEPVHQLASLLLSDGFVNRISGLNIWLHDRLAVSLLDLGLHAQLAATTKVARKANAWEQEVSRMVKVLSSMMEAAAD